MILNNHPSARRRVELDLFGDGLFPCNPTIVADGDEFVCLIRGVDYDREAIYYSGDWQSRNREERSCRFKIVRLDQHLRVMAVAELGGSRVASHPPCSNWIEDPRLFKLGETLMVAGTYRASREMRVGARWTALEQRCQVFTGQILGSRLCNLHLYASPGNLDWDKNWLPRVCSPVSFDLIVNLNTGAALTATIAGGAIRTTPRGSAADFAWRGGWSGSSCLAPYRDGYLAVVHRATQPPPRLYRHMLIYADRDLRVRRRSPVFSFEGAPVEFCCGLVVDEIRDRAIFSYGRFDKTGTLLEFGLDDLAGLLTFAVDEEHPIDAVAVDETLPLPVALKCVAGHEDHIWRLMDELVAAQSRIDALTAEIAGIEAQVWRLTL